jgi:hypothetical protein
MYQNQLQKAYPFFYLYDYIKNVTLQLNRNLSVSIQNYKSNYRKTLLNFLDYFYEENLYNFDEIVAFSQERQHIINNSYVRI